VSETQFQPDWFSKPGDTLHALMVRRGLSLTSLASEIGCSRAAVKSLLAGTLDVDDQLAAKLARAVGVTPGFWQRRQSTYQKALARVAESVPKDRGAAWLERFPRSEMASQGWVAATRRADAVRSYLAYFGVNSPEAWEKRYADLLTQTAFRTSRTFESKVGPLSAWLRRGEIEASLVPCAPWDREALRSRLPELRSLAKSKRPDYFVPRLRSICAAAGVALVFVPAPPGCRASGAMRFISPDKAMVIVSFRYLSDDHFWFTFFHEIGHLILHRASTFVDGEAVLESDRERQANEFAAGVLIPLDRRDELAALSPRTENVVRFAVSIGVSRGIVVGQLQHLGIIGHGKLNSLKRRYKPEEISAAFA